MIKLSDRLQLIANRIKRGETMADIGTDHGFLPLYLIEQGISPKVILSDISGPSLSKAIEAAEERNITDDVDFREGYGLDVLRLGEVDAVVIAGMGGILMTEILGKDPERTVSIRKYILQPRNHAGYLRQWLSSKGFTIRENALVREGKFICEVIVAFAPKTFQNGDFGPLEGEPSWDLPADTRSEEPGLVREYAERKIAQEEKILAGLDKSRSTSPQDVENIKQRIDYFRRVQHDQL